MNVLLDTFPTKIEVNKKICDINSDFRDCLEIILAFENEELTKAEQLNIMCNLLYKENISNKDFTEACMQAIKFLNCGEEEKFTNIDEESRKNIKKLYSFDKDAKYIYSAIKDTHKIDLEMIEYLHWWKFVYFFLDLNSETYFSQILYLRRRKNEGKLSDEERKTFYQMRKILDLEYVDLDKREKTEFELLLEEGNSERKD